MPAGQACQSLYKGANSTTDPQNTVSINTIPYLLFVSKDKFSPFLYMILKTLLMTFLRFFAYFADSNVFCMKSLLTIQKYKYSR